MIRKFLLNRWGGILMKNAKKLLAAAIFGCCMTEGIAAPMPNSIVVENKAVVPVLKSQVIRKVEGQAPIRRVEATIFEVTNKGQNIVAREVVLQDGETQFSDKKLSIPVLKPAGVIVPISKIELNTTYKQDGEVMSKSKSIDATGVEFIEGKAPIHRELKLDQLTISEANEKVTHAVVKEDGVQTKDLIIFSEND